MSTIDYTQTPNPLPTDTPPPNPGEPDKEARLWATFCHLSPLLAWLGLPFGTIIGPLVFWLIKRNEMPFVDDQGKESVNFHLSILIYALAAGTVAFIFALTVVLTILAVPVLIAIIALAIFEFVQVIMASIKANQGTAYRYPLAIRLIK